jgi:hypothetical protein
MTVHELIEALKKLDGSANVILCEQPRYPVEHRLAGVVRRASCVGEHDGLRCDAGRTPSDVLLVEGEWLGYGEGGAWRAARRLRAR